MLLHKTGTHFFFPPKNGIDRASCLEEAGGENAGLTSATGMPKKPDMSHSQTRLTLSLPLSFDGGWGQFPLPIH